MNRTSLEKLQKRTLPVEIDGEKLYVRKISGAQAMAYHAYTEIEPQPAGIELMGSLLQVAMCDEAGERLYSDGDEELKRLTVEVPWDCIALLFKEATVFNKLNRDASEKEPGNSQAAS